MAITSTNERVIAWLNSVGIDMPKNAKEVVIRVPAIGLPTIEIHSYLEGKFFEVEAPFKAE